MELELETRFEAGYAVVKPGGEIDLSNVDAFREVLNELLIQGHAHVLVDLDETHFIDSLGFGALVSARRKARAFNGSLGIVCSGDRILRLFKVTGLDKVFKITESTGDQPLLPGAGERSGASPS